ncbi:MULTISPECIES: oxygen-insensitive NADPH nitroreductase [Vibrio]|uniref:Oxygen-insensitive NADPH nitroreductase n=1 Tax=Vibrio algicola TaxID=2662262 RepID=A0A5Q0TEG3_9VIBR|nr:MULTISPECIES: oxygen-insensitive NADPH nitroreductase [Vibrio]MBD1576707.1 oxygen-insensitive NADPH nitroreductase [Vibrio sp. S11_S32]
MNTVIDTMMAHRSIRAFTPETITTEQLETILAAGISASSSSFLQTTSIIRVTDPVKRKALAAFAGGQNYVETAAEFLVFCIDYQRHYQLSNQVQPEFTELTLIGAIDAGIMAQNTLLAAESLGLGGVYIGGLRNSPKEVDELLGLPKYCAMMFGMCLGHPDQEPQIKPRLPQKVMIHQDSYQALSTDDITEYDQQTAHYYQTRVSNQKSGSWSDHIAERLGKESRPFIKDYLNSKGLATK